MASISVIVNMNKVNSALKGLFAFPGLVLEIQYTADGQLLMTVKHNEYKIVCDFIYNLYVADLVPGEWKGEI